MKKHLTFKEFMRLSREEQNTRYKELSEHDKFLARISDVGADVGNRNSKPLSKEEILKIVLASSVPLNLANMKVNIGLCLVGVIIGEFIGARQGLGYLIIYGSQTFQ